MASEDANRCRWLLQNATPLVTGCCRHRLDNVWAMQHPLWRPPGQTERENRDRNGGSRWGRTCDKWQWPMGAHLARVSLGTGLQRGPRRDEERERERERERDRPVRLRPFPLRPLGLWRVTRSPPSSDCSEPCSRPGAQRALSRDWLACGKTGAKGRLGFMNGFGVVAGGLGRSECDARQLGVR